MTSRAWMWAAALAVAAALGTGGVARADTITINDYADPATGTCPDACSLRHAVAESAPRDTIHIPAQNGVPVTLGQGAPITVSHELTITGDGMDATTIDGSANVDGKQNPHRIFTVSAPLQLSGLTLHGGNSAGDDTCPSACSTLGLNGGGAIFSTSTLNLDHVRFTDNRAAVGGALSISGTLDMADVEFAGGSAAFGGGLFVRGTAAVQRASFHDLGDGGYGGGAIFVYRGSLALGDSTVANSGWGSSLGGGIENSGGTLSLTRDTLAGNVRGAIMTDSGGRTEVGGTIIGAGFDDNGDWACTPSGRSTNADGKTGPAITQDDGDNLDEDGHCGLSAPGDRSGDAHLAPLADNGGASPTMALLHGSPALDALFCQGLDERGIDRPQHGLCDIGAFEAERTGDTPSAATQDATAIDPYSARLNASVDLEGEAGGAHFEWGTSQDQVAAGQGTSTPVVAAGRSSTAGFTLAGLKPDRTYYFRAVADNATAASSPGETRSFTTAPGRPDVSGLALDAITDSGATVSFTIDPNGADTSYVVKWGTDTPTASMDAVDLGADPGPRQVSVRLDKLQPDTSYVVEVVATNSEAPDGVSSGTLFATEPQITGHQGGLVTVRDSGDGCPTATIDWGDGSPAEAGAVQCQVGGEFGRTFALEAGHEYARAGHYPIQIAYSTGRTAEQWALISAPQQATPTPTPTPTATPTPAPTATPSPPPTPVFHQQVVVRPVSGTVLVRRKGTNTFVPLDAKAGLPLGSQVDVTHGRIALTSVPRRGGKPETAQFYAGIFTVTQSGSVTVLTLSGPKPTCTPARGRASAAAKQKKVSSRKLWGNGHGSFRTSGQYSAATVRGTQWLVQDTCAGTLTRVAHGLVAVIDRVRHKTILVRGGTSYLARPRR